MDFLFGSIYPGRECRSMKMTEYNRDQMEAIRMVRHYLNSLSRPEIWQLRKRVEPYLRFRADVLRFQEQHLNETCTRKCFTGQSSACCNREGIATFFADVVINSLLSSDEEIDVSLEALSRDQGGFKCVYLSSHGCLWRLKPIVCEMFLCEHARETLVRSEETLLGRWEALRRREKEYTWPDKPVLFDDLEEVFINAGFDSPLMYFHRSPGLLRVKATSRRETSH